VLGRISRSTEYMGNWSGPPRPKKKAGVTTSVRIDIELYVAAQARGINVSDVTNRALRSVLKLDDADMTDEQVAALLKERAGRLENVVVEANELEAKTYADAIVEVQRVWNKYIASAPDADRAARLEWVAAKREQNRVLQGQTAEAILADLEGS
jgi:post-segregation antitoxin (ccd killing protein)